MGKPTSARPHRPERGKEAPKVEREGRHGEPTSDDAAAALAAPKLEREGRHEDPKGDDAAAALRKEAEAALKLERKGRHREAIKRVQGLLAKHRGSALLLHLAGHLHHAAALRGINPGYGPDHIVTAHGYLARGYLAQAKRLVPNCIVISDLLARVLFLAMKLVEAEREAREAVSIAAPVDPAEYSVLYTLGPSTSATREGGRLQEIGSRNPRLH